MLAMIEQLLYTQLFEIIKNTGRGYKRKQSIIWVRNFEDGLAL